MKIVDLDQPDESPEDKAYQNLEFATEVAYSTLVARAIKDGLLPLPVNPPFDEFPDENIVQQFKDVCKAIIETLKSAEQPK